jgi:hypothetical protein
MGKLLDTMNEAGMLDWATLLVGLYERWLTREDAVAFAVNWLVANPDESDDQIIELAGLDYASDREIRELVAKVAQRNSAFIETDEERYKSEMEKWRFAHLKILDEAKLPDSQKIDELQQLIADFGYPQDMADCSIYGTPGIDPLSALKKVIANLRVGLSIRFTKP